MPTTHHEPRPPRRTARRSTGVDPGRRRRRSRRPAIGPWARSSVARLPIGPGLLVVATLLVAFALRSSALDPTSDPFATTPTVVAVVALTTGDVVEADDIEVRALATGALPGATTADADEIVGRQVTATIYEGEAVSANRLAPAGLLGVAAATPAGWSSFALPADDRMPATAVGQLVELYALDSITDTSARGREADRLTRSAVVVAVDDRRITVAVEPADAPEVAAALIGTTVVLAVSGP